MQCKNVFATIYKDTYDKVLIYVLAKCGKIPEIQDIVQEVYTELFNTLAQKGEGYIKCPEAFVMRLAKSKVYQYYSEKERQMVHGLAEYVDVTEQESEVISDGVWEDSLLDKLTAEEVMEYISEKDELTRDIFYQHYFQDKTLKEIADAHGVKESTVKTRLYRTLRELKGMKRFAFIAAILLLAALLAKPVYTLAEEVVTKIRNIMLYKTNSSEEEREQRKKEYEITTLEEFLDSTVWESEEAKEEVRKKALDFIDAKEEKE